MDELVRLGAHTVVGASVVVAWVVIVAVIHRLPPVRRPLASEHGFERTALDVRRNFLPREVEKCRREIYIERERSRHLARFHAWTAHE